eukprot:jgi/Tetstr1/444677/TSEL_032525.t1
MGSARTQQQSGKPQRTQRVRVKLVCFGSTRVGKTALLQRYCTDTFSHKTEETAGVNHVVKGVQLGNVEVRLNIWDLAGSDEFLQVRNEFYKEAQGAVLVYDCTNRESFEALDRWRDEAIQYGGRDSIMIVAATKADLRSKYVPREEGETWARQNGCQFFEVSAQSGAQVAPLFATLLAQLLPSVAGVPQEAISESIRRISTATCGPESKHGARRAAGAERPQAAAPPPRPEFQRRSSDVSGGVPGMNPTPAAATFTGSYSFSAGAPSSGLSASASMRKASEEAIEARIQERTAEWTQQERVRANNEAARASIREQVKKRLSRVEAFTDVAQILRAFGYTCDAKDVKRSFKLAIIELHPDKIAQSGQASLEEAVRTEEMFKILMSKKHLL